MHQIYSRTISNACPADNEHHESHKLVGVLEREQVHHNKRDAQHIKRDIRKPLYLLISCRVMSGPPTMLNMMPLAWDMGNPSSGEEMAATAASTARDLPLPWPMPISAVPVNVHIYI